RGASTRKAKSICAECEVKQQCLDYAIEMGEKFGIWGGLSELERSRERRARAIRERKVGSWVLTGRATRARLLRWVVADRGSVVSAFAPIAPAPPSAGSTGSPGCRGTAPPAIR